MKVNEIKKYIISGKKYIIGFILGLSLISTFAYAADSGSIGALFEKIGTNWFLKGENIKDISISKDKLIGNIPADKLDINVNNLLNKFVPTKVSQLSNDSGFISNGSDVNINNLDIKGSIINSSSTSFFDPFWGFPVYIPNPVTINDSINVTGNINANSISINGDSLVKRIFTVDDNWRTIIDTGAKRRVDNYTTSIIASKPITKVRISGMVDDAGGCGIFVPGKLGLVILHDGHIVGTGINDNNFNWTRNRIGSWGSYGPVEFDLASLSGIYYGASSSFNTYGYYNPSGYKYINQGDNINLIMKLVDYGGEYKMSCKVEVKYGEWLY